MATHRPVPKEMVPKEILMDAPLSLLTNCWTDPSSRPLSTLKRFPELIWKLTWAKDYSTTSLVYSMCSGCQKHRHGLSQCQLASVSEHCLGDMLNSATET